MYVLGRLQHGADMNLIAADHVTTGMSGAVQCDVVEDGHEVGVTQVPQRLDAALASNDDESGSLCRKRANTRTLSSVCPGMNGAPSQVPQRPAQRVEARPAGLLWGLRKISNPLQGD
jgi:hypothetical protein